MPSNRKQINVRLDPETELRLASLIPRVSAALGLNVSQSDLFRLGLIELDKKFPPDESQTEATSTSKRK